MAPDADHANPRLGPGCYTADEPALISGKLFGDEGYAPFASLTPRQSYFDQTISRGPAPGAYPVENLRPALHSPHKAPEFGMSRVARFGKLTNQNPGPGTYRVPDALAPRKNKARAKAEQQLELGSRTHPLTRQPLRGTTAEDGEEGVGGGGGGGVLTVEAAARAAVAVGGMQKVSRRSSDPGKSSVHGHGMAKGNKPAPYSNSAGAHSKIVWRRKHGAPSIPPTRTAFGFQENADGDLVPRKPPKRLADPAPAYNSITSFAERAKHEHRGPTFMHGEASPDGSRLYFRTLDTPAPGVYENYKVQNYYTKHGTGNEAAIMTLAPCVRLTDEILKDSKKKNVPGPGAYNIKAPIAEDLARPRNRMLFSTIGGHVHPAEYMNTEQIRTPGPGAYHPETAEAPKPPIVRPQPFGSTTSRFDDAASFKSKSAPAPGSYEVDENLDPGPGTYDPDTYEAAHHSGEQPGTPQPQHPQQQQSLSSPPGIAPQSAVRLTRSSGGGNAGRPPTRITKLTGQGPAHFAVGNLLVNPAKAHAPVFGSQTERFADGSTRADLPPPGAYEIASAYESLKVSKNRVPKTAGMISRTPREVFAVKERLPGPGQYEPLILEKRDMRRGDNAQFMTTEERFKFSTNAVPGPGAYLSPEHNSGLLKKTYNITLTEWSRQQLAASAEDRLQSTEQVSAH
ncbi:Sperm-tail PG-rich repeat-containing protein 2 [Geranomyces michiganensis]|nr:Sperm-tail PG-rich repeat-containing protein 2 [Geranomyces michiganensis]